MILSITKNPSPILRKKLSRISRDQLDGLAPIVENMIETMIDAHGIGIAANQVGHDMRLIVVDTKDGPKVFVNPRILYKSLLKERMEEGCLSVPGYWGTVNRARYIRFHAYTPRGKHVLMSARGLFARVMQHEIDHINGVLFIDRSKDVRKGERTE